ncbi:MAG: hypothetical protein H0X45_08880 [Planctomycetes bacterium]|nr:hypothetical protein [Planctomycetota bacterium]
MIRLRHALTPALILTVACVPSLHAAVPKLDDVRIFYAPLLGDESRVQGDLDQEVPATGESTHEPISTGDKLDYHRRAGIGWYQSAHALQPAVGSFAYGVELAFDRMRETQDDKQLDGEAVLIDVFAGWAWALTPRWHFEQGLLLGAGEARWDFVAHVGEKDWISDSTDFVYEYGFRVGTAWTFASGWQAGIDLRHLVTRSQGAFRRADQEPGGETVIQSYRPDIEIRGFGVMATIGYRF